MLDYCSRLHKPKLGSLLSRIKMLLHKSTSCPSDIYHSCLHLISPSGSSACFTWMQAIKLQRTTRVWKPPPARRRGRGTSTQCENSSCHVHAPIQRTFNFRQCCPYTECEVHKYLYYFGRIRYDRAHIIRAWRKSPAAPSWHFRRCGRPCSLHCESTAAIGRCLWYLYHLSHISLIRYHLRITYMCVCTVWKRDMHASIYVFGRCRMNRGSRGGDGYDVDFVPAPAPHKVHGRVRTGASCVCICYSLWGRRTDDWMILSVSRVHEDIIILGLYIEELKWRNKGATGQSQEAMLVWGWWFGRRNEVAGL